MTKSKRISKELHTHSGKSSQRDRIIGRVTAAFRMKGKLALREIYRLKRGTPETELFAVFPRIFVNRNDLDFVHGSAFPPKLSGLFSEPALYKPAESLTEVIWTICRCLQFSNELKEFLQLREEYERSLLLDLKDRCYEILDLVEKKFGYSVWLLQNKLAAAQYWEGIEETRKLVKAYKEECKGHALISTILWFIGKRIEATGLKGYSNGE